MNKQPFSDSYEITIISFPLMTNINNTIIFEQPLKC